MSQIYNDNIKRSKPQNILLRISLKIQQRASDPGESFAGVTAFGVNINIPTNLI